MGRDVSELLRPTGLVAGQFNDPDARISADRAEAVWQAAYAQSGDPALALHVAERLETTDYPVFHHLGRNSPTLGEALERLVRYFDYVDPRVGFEIVRSRFRGDAVVLLRMSVPSLNGQVPRPPAEYTLAAIHRLQRQSTGLRWPLLELRVQFAEPSDAAEIRRVFACPVRFASEFTELVSSEAIWHQAVPGADALLLNM